MTLVGQKSTYQVIHSLPDSATEWQKDSAVQAYFRPGENNRYSDRPDTLGLPGRRYDPPAGYLRTDSLAYPVAYVDTMPLSCRPTSTTVMPEPVTYRAGSDNLVSTLLMGSLIVGLLSLAFSGKFIMRMSKNFFYVENERTTTVPDTASELRHQGILVVITSIMLGVVCYGITLHADMEGWTAVERRPLLAICLASIVAFFLFKAALYQFVNWVFFDRKKNEQWNKSLLFLTAMEGVVLTPIVMALVFGDLSLSAALIGMAIVVFLGKILTFYKSYLIFFRRTGAFLQNFMYFCALELIPLVGLVGLLEAFSHFLKIIF